MNSDDIMAYMAYGFAIVIFVGLIGIGLGGLFYGESQSTTGQGYVVAISQYPAGTIQDGVTYTIIGYNLTVSYHDQVTYTTVTCPLYHVGSQIPAGYFQGWWGKGYIYVGDFPSGCD
jgi:hypothetical protein